MMDGPETPPNRFNVPEPPTGLGSGFLTEYWQSQRGLPVMKGLEVLWYYLQQGVRTIVALPTSSAITVMTIAVSLFMLAGFLLTLQNVGRLLSEAGTTLYVTAYIREDAESAAVTRFVEELRRNSRIRSAEYVSKEKALEIFRNDLGSRSGFLDGLEENNPLPASVDIVLRPDDLGAHNIDALIKSLRAQQVVEDLVYGSEWVERMQRVLQVFRMFGVIGLLIALGIIVFLISNTIKLVIYARRDEIGIMQLVGASDSFIRIPFLIGGLLQGFAGAVIGLLFLNLGFLLLNFELRNSNILGVALPELVFLNVWAVFGIAAVGLVVGAVGSLFALRKFMNV